MYPVSEAFHEAVANGSKQLAMMIFPDCVFTNEDINVSRGIQFDDHFNTETDLSIGQTPSNSVSFSLFNDNGLLDSYGFGKFTATIGVLIGSENYQQTGSVMMTTVYSQYIGNERNPFLLRGGSPVSVQPNFPVKSMLGYNGKVWVFGETGQYAVYNDATGDNITASSPVIPFMREKSKRWAGKGMFYNPSSRILMVYEAGTRFRYEFAPLGVFIANRPDIPDKIEISMTCYDQMQLAETDMPSASRLGIGYPTTVGTLLGRICAYLGVEYRTLSFLNSGGDILAEPEAFKDATIRTVLSWIAEVAGSNIRFDRDGKLSVEWIRETSMSMDEHNYQKFDPFWYQTPRIDKLYVRDTNNNHETIYGSGAIPYLIQDNPLLGG